MTRLPGAPPLRRSLLQGGWASAAWGVTLAAGVARTLVVARFLAPADFGVMALAALVLGALDVFTGFGLETTLVRQRGDLRRWLGTAFTLEALRGLLLACLVWILAPAAAGFFGDVRAAPVLRACALVPLLRGLANPGMALFRRRLRFDRLFWLTLPEVLAGLALAVSVAAVRRDVWSLVAAAVGAQAAATITSHLAAPWRARPELSRARAGALLRSGGWVQGTSALMFLSLQADNAVVGKVLGTASLGLYQVAYRIAELPVGAVTHAAARIQLPTLVGLRGDPAALRAWYARALALVLAANGAFAAGVFLLGGPVVALVLGPQWLQALPALRILSVAMCFRSVLILGSELFYALGRPHLTFQVNLVRLAALLVALVPLTRAYGTEGAALAVLAAGVAALPLYLWHAARVMRDERIVAVAAPPHLRSV